MDTLATKTSVKVVGSNGQISLGKEFAGRQVLVEEQEPGVWLVRTAMVIPENELWLHQPQARAELERALDWAKRNPPKESDPDAILKRLKKVRLDLNAETFQKTWLQLDKSERDRVTDTLKKLLQLTWDQVYRDAGLKWEKVSSIKPPPGIDAIYTLRITRSRRATAYRQGDFLRFLTIEPDHDAAYGKK
jgi:hypothetical protein